MENKKFQQEYPNRNKNDKILPDSDMDKFYLKLQCKIINDVNKKISIMSLP